MSSDVLIRARALQRDTAGSTAVTIRLAFLQDLISEIERLQTLLALDNPVGRSLKAVTDQTKEKAHGSPQK